MRINRILLWLMIFLASIMTVSAYDYTITEWSNSDGTPHTYDNNLYTLLGHPKWINFNMPGNVTLVNISFISANSVFETDLKYRFYNSSYDLYDGAIEYVNGETYHYVNVSRLNSSIALTLEHNLYLNTNYTIIFNVTLDDQFNGRSYPIFSLGVRNSTVCNEFSIAPDGRSDCKNNYQTRTKILQATSGVTVNHVCDWNVITNGTHFKIYNNTDKQLLAESVTNATILSLMWYTPRASITSEDYTVSSIGWVKGIQPISGNAGQILYRNLSVKVGDETNPPEFNYVEFLSREIKQYHLFNTSYINNIINNECICDGCTYNPDETECRIPFYFYSDTMRDDNFAIMTTVLEDVRQTLNVGTCTDYTYPILNITYYDEIDNRSIDVELGYDIYFDFGDEIQSFSGSYGNDTVHSFCTDSDPIVDNFSLNVWGNFLIEKTDYATRYIELDEQQAIRASNSPTTIQPYYMISLSNSTTVAYNWYTSNYESISGILEIYRCMGDGTKNLVESTPITDSQAVANIELLNIPYSYRIIYQGNIYTNNDSYSACHIESSNSITYYVDVSDIDISGYIGLNDIVCNITYTAVDQFLFTWEDNTYSDTEVKGCAFVKRYGVNGYVVTDTLCDTDNSITGSMPITGYNYIVEAKLYQNGYYKTCGALSFNLDTDTPELFGTTVIFGIILLIGCLALIWATENELALIGAAIGIVIVWFIGVTKFGWLEVSAMITFLMVIAYIGRKLRYTT